MESEKITQFCGVTGATPDRAKFFLESAGWNLQAAMDSFFSNAGSDMGDGPEETVQAREESVRSRQPASSNSRFNSMSAMLSRSERPDDDEERGQEFFAGGSERSGQVISGPPRKKRASDLAKSVFEGAREHGAQSLEDEEAERHKESARSFRGAGYRLGETPEESKLVSMPEPDVKPPAREEVTLQFWSNGFSMDDGPLRDGSTDADRALLDSIRKGEMPNELRERAIKSGQEIHVNIVDNSSSEYVKPKKKVAAFSGSGHRLGSPAPNVSLFDEASSNGSSSQQPSASSAAAQTTGHSVDSSKPVTKLQIRLADGTRLAANFNHDQTVGSIRNFINQSRPGMAGKTYCLMTTFPNKELTNEEETLVEAKLLNAVVVQRMK